MKKVAVIMGSASDLPIAEKCTLKLKALGIEYTVRVMSAHRTPDEVTEFASKAEDEGFSAIISIAGKAAHLGGVIASQTTLPVIGIPCQSSDLGGMDALLSTAQMPPGIPVASMAINGAVNAAIFVAEILATSDKEIRKALKEDRKKMREAVYQADKEIQEKLS